MKKILSVMLAMLLIISITIPAYAMDDGKTAYDVSVDIYTPKSFEYIFSSQTQRSMDVTSIDQVAYNYTISPIPDNEELAEVYLNFTLSILNETYNFSTNGFVNSYELSSGNTLWEGPTRGVERINGIDYSVIAGFSKLDNSPAIQVNVTIQALYEEDSIEPLIISFGDQVITQDIYQELVRSSSTVSMPEQTADVSFNSSSSFALVGSDYANFYNLNAGYAQQVRGYFDSVANQFAVSVKTYGSNLENWANQTSTIDADTNVHSFEIRLISNSTSGGSNSWIDNVHSYDFAESNFGGGAVLIKALFEDILSLLGVPTSTISSMLDGLKGSVDDDIKADEGSVSVSFGLTQSADFDASDVGIPIVFQLDCVPSTYTGNSSYTFASSITYRTWWWPSSSNMPSWFYRDAYEATDTVTISLS